MMIDLRSDTVTKPTPGMLQAMFEAKVGDDVFGEDPSINALEAKCAAMFGMEAAIFCASGTMTNQIAIKCHTQPGDEIICEKLSHIYQYEGGGIGFNAGCSVKLIDGDRGRVAAEQVKESINNRGDVHKAYSSLVSLENTTNRGGGACYNFEDFYKIKAVCQENGLAYHLDGARIFNAIVANNESTLEYGQLFDSISVCLSKGLGTPVGSVLLGKKAFITKARRIRKIFGGGMRQAGFLAAAGIYALDNNVARLAEDHTKARAIAKALSKKDFAKDLLPVETNIVICGIYGRYTSATLAAELKKHDILSIAISPTQIRLVLHLDITDEMVNKVIEVIEKL